MSDLSHGECTCWHWGVVDWRVWITEMLITDSALYSYYLCVYACVCVCVCVCVRVRVRVRVSGHVGCVQVSNAYRGNASAVIIANGVAFASNPPSRGRITGIVKSCNEDVMMMSL